MQVVRRLIHMPRLRGIRLRRGSRRATLPSPPRRRTLAERQEVEQIRQAVDALRASIAHARPWSALPGLHLSLVGQLPSGKNQMGVNVAREAGELEPAKRRHHSNPRFKRWRADAERQLLTQLRDWKAVLPIRSPMLMYVWYWPGDRVTRDRSGMLDALFHMFEMAGLVKNDGLIEDPLWRTMPIDRKQPRVEIVLRPYLPLFSADGCYQPQWEVPACINCGNYLPATGPSACA